MPVLSGKWKFVDSPTFTTDIQTILSNGYTSGPNNEQFRGLLLLKSRAGIAYVDRGGVESHVLDYGEWWGEEWKTIDCGETGSEVNDTFYGIFTANATQQAVFDPGPDWSNSFIKTASGNKAVQKVWLKQNGQLVTVWELPVATHKLFASGDMAQNGGELSLFINGQNYDLKDDSTDYVEIKTGDVIEGSAFISHNEFMALALKGVDTGTIYAQGDGGIDGAYLDVAYTVPSTLTEDLIFVEVEA